MRTINTVTGEIQGNELGLIAPHEHLFLNLTVEALNPHTPEQEELFYQKVSIKNIGILRRNPFVVLDNVTLESVDTAIYEVNKFKKTGGNTLVDLTLDGMGRDLRLLRKVSMETGVNIIVGCGLYTDITIPEKYHTMSADQIASWMIDEIKNGEKETGIKPGVIGEIGTSETISNLEEKSLYASAFASNETGLPIYIHTYSWSTVSLDAIRILTDEGVPPEKICICHMDVEFDYKYLKDVFATGAYVMFDNFGKEYYFEKQPGVFSGGPFATDIERVRMLIKLISEGHTNRLMLATDVCLKSLLHSYGGWGYDHVFTNIIPMMRMEGISPEDINTIIYDNPNSYICS